jgi:hypothetical protein
MRVDTARKPGNVVDDDDDRLSAILAVLAQIGEHRLHPGACGEASGHVVVEDLDDIQSLVASVFAAAGFLRAKTVTAGRLLGARNAAIDDGLGVGPELLVFFAARAQVSNDPLRTERVLTWERGLLD